MHYWRILSQNNIKNGPNETGILWKVFGASKVKSLGNGHGEEKQTPHLGVGWTCKTWTSSSRAPRGSTVNRWAETGLQRLSFPFSMLPMPSRSMPSAALLESSSEVQKKDATRQHVCAGFFQREMESNWASKTMPRATCHRFSGSPESEAWERPDPTLTQRTLTCFFLPFLWPNLLCKVIGAPFCAIN